MLRRFTSERIRKAHHKRVAFSIGLWVGLGVSIVLLILTLFWSKQIAIKSVSFEGNKVVSGAELFAVVAPHLEGAYGHLLPRRNTFIFPKDDIEADILASFVRIEKVAIDREGFSKILVAVVERDSTGLWCGPSTTASCYFIDETALAFAVAPRLNGRSFVVYERALPLKPVGTTLTSEESFIELGHLIDSVATLGFNTRRVVWKDDALELVTMFATKTGNEDVRLRVPLTGPYEQTFTNLASIVQSQGDKIRLRQGFGETRVGADEQPFVFSNLEYIDLRFENRIFYKEEVGVPEVME